MQPDELKTIQAKLSKTNRQMADLLGVSEATIVKWRGAQHPIPHIAAIAIRALAARSAA